MKKFIYSLKILFLLFGVTRVAAQDTFSICAVELATGQVGSAGATCITSSSTSVNIISDVHPGVGVVHTQASWIQANYDYGKTLMNLGTLSPQQIIDSLVKNDKGGNSTIRQYGVVDMKGGVGRSAGYTGVNCTDWKGHRFKDTLGYSYAIQGNILLGQKVLDSVEARFLRTEGTLACKLMAALQGGKMVGADTRCASYNISTFSAVLRVANPTDPVNNLYLDLTVNTYKVLGPWIDPIDSMQKKFDAWGGCAAAYISSAVVNEGIKIFPNPVSNVLNVRAEGALQLSCISILDLIGNRLKQVELSGQKQVTINIADLPPGVYFVEVENESGRRFASKIIRE